MPLFKTKSKVGEQKSDTMISNPHIIEIKNKSSKVQNFVLFGSNMHLNEPNFGNDKSISLSYLSEDVPYSAILNEMLTTSYKISLMRIQSDNKKNISQTLSYNKYNCNVGMFDVVFTRREIKLAIIMDAYQMQSDILDVRVPSFDLDKYHYIFGCIEPKSTIIISVFPIEIDSVKYQNARLSGNNIAPVIINTTSKMKRILHGWETFLSKLKNIFKRKK